MSTVSLALSGHLPAIRSYCVSRSAWLSISSSNTSTLLPDVAPILDAIMSLMPAMEPMPILSSTVLGFTWITPSDVSDANTCKSKSYPYWISLAYSSISSFSSRNSLNPFRLLILASAFIMLNISPMTSEEYTLSRSWSVSFVWVSIRELSKADVSTDRFWIETG